jgi:hypothetical protein
VQLYTSTKFPHSSSRRGQLVEVMSKRSTHEAIAYLYAILPGTGHQFDARHPDAWKGLISGILDRPDITALPAETYQAALASTDALRAKLEMEIGTRKRSFDALQRKYNELVKKIEDSDKTQHQNFTDLMHKINTAHEMALAEHQKAMDTIQEVFRTSMALRAPVSYWKDKADLHEKQSKNARNVVIVGMFSLIALAFIAPFLFFGDVPRGTLPEPWKLTLLGFFSILGIWSMRLIVRVYLSHSHLANDAAERVTMAQTYLALQEESVQASNEDRTLILASLFRPASDGMVKDDSLPNPALDILTRSSR